MSRGLAAALVLTAMLSALLSGCSSCTGQRLPKGDAVVVSEWVPIVKELQARGITDAVTIVGVLASYDLPLESGQMVLGRLPRASTTVSSVLGRDVTELKTGYVARTATPATASGLLAELKALAPKLEHLPGVRGVPRFVAFEPAQLAIYTRNFAAQEGIPIPTASQVSLDWIPLLRALRSRGFDDPVVLQFVVHRARLRLKSGAVVEPLDEDARYLTVANAFGLDPTKFRQESMHRLMLAVPGGPNPIPKAKEARAVLVTLPDVAGIEEIPLTPPLPPVKRYREGDELIAPPWVAFPEPPSSLRWRMGPGEDYMDRWLPFWRGLPEDARRRYLGHHPPPPEWQAWIAAVD